MSYFYKMCNSRKYLTFPIEGIAPPTPLEIPIKLDETVFWS